MYLMTTEHAVKRVSYWRYHRALVGKYEAMTDFEIISEAFYAYKFVCSLPVTWMFFWKGVPVDWRKESFIAHVVKSYAKPYDRELLPTMLETYHNNRSVMHLFNLSDHRVRGFSGYMYHTPVADSPMYTEIRKRKLYLLTHTENKFAERLRLIRNFFGKD